MHSNSNYVLDHYPHRDGGVIYQAATRSGSIIAEGVGLTAGEAIADLASQVHMLNCLGCGRELITLRTDREPDSRCGACLLVNARGYVKMDAGKRAAVRAALPRQEKAKPPMTQHVIDPALAAALKGLLK